MPKARLVLASLLLLGCSGRVTPSTQPSFTLTSATPFVVELGRGSGWHGYDIVRFDDTGLATVTRFERRDPPDTTTLQLSSGDLNSLVACINTQNISAMGSRYTADVVDGTQWIFWMQQGSSEKAIWFDNTFPKPIETLAASLDAALANAGLAAARWTPISPAAAKTQQ